MCGVQRCCRSTLDQASTEEFWSSRIQRESDNIHSRLLNRQGLGPQPVHHTSTPAVCPGSLYNHSAPTIYQTKRQQYIWSQRDNRHQVYAQPVKRNNNQSKFIEIL